MSDGDVALENGAWMLHSTPRIADMRLADALVFVLVIARDIDIANLSVCPSVRNVPVSDENGLTYRHSFFFHIR